MPVMSIVAADEKRDMDVVRGLFQEYQAFLNVDMCFQGFSEELTGLPGKYASPGGGILLARDGTGQVAGVVALRPLPGKPDICEMKRLWVRPHWRGQGLGKRLAVAVMDMARQKGYRSVVLDTLETLTEAVLLYRALGFVGTAPYYDNPLEGAVYMKCDMQTA